MKERKNYIIEILVKDYKLLEYATGGRVRSLQFT